MILDLLRYCDKRDMAKILDLQDIDLGVWVVRSKRFERMDYPRYE
jgi:hypothetical protein